MSKKFLDQAYGLDSIDKTKAFYNDWAASYDEEVSENGYTSPMRVAQALSLSRADLNCPLLDIGCGTGVSGLFLKQVGFDLLHGSDINETMLARAKEKQIYQELHLANLNDPLGFVNTPYCTVTAIGVFSPGHAPASSIHGILDVLQIGGFFGFSLNDHALADPAYLEVVAALVLQGKIRIRWQDYGDHLPKIKLNSMVMVVEKLC